MGQKVDPRGFRVGVTKSWSSEWFAKSKQQSADFFVEDIQVRKYIEDKFKRAGIGKVVIRKTDKEIECILFSAKPALIIGNNGSKLLDLQKELEKKFAKPFKVVVKDIKIPELSAKVMVEFAATQLEARMPFRKVCKTIIQRVMEKGAMGVKVKIAGRLGGVDLSRSEKFNKGRVPLQTIRTELDYHYGTALTKYGILGIKIWIAKGESNIKVKGSKAPRPELNVD